MKIQKTDLKKYTTIGIGPEVKVWFPENEQEISRCTQKIIIGNGSNLLVEEDFIMELVSLSGLKDIRLENNIMYAQAGVPFSSILGTCIKNGLSGLSEYVGIPGSVGGMIWMNAGGIGNNKYLRKIRCFSKGAGVHDIDVPGGDFGYRNSPFDRDVIIVGAFFEFKKSSIGVVKREVQQYLQKKKASQPLFKKTFGSVFRNPQNLSAWKLIADCGLKGVKKGDAQISEKHCNFIINHGNASFSDVLYLIELCEEKVYNKFNIRLEREVVVLGSGS